MNQDPVKIQQQLNALLSGIQSSVGSSKCKMTFDGLLNLLAIEIDPNDLLQQGLNEENLRKFLNELSSEILDLFNKSKLDLAQKVVETRQRQIAENGGVDDMLGQGGNSTPQSPQQIPEDA